MILRTKIIGLLLILAVADISHAQNSFQAILQQIDTNNLALKVYRQQLEADKLASRIGLSPSNPQAEVIYQWGSPVDIGNKTTISITQEFDFPTAYIYRSRLAKGSANSYQHEYSIKRAEVLQNASRIYADIVYYNALVAELQRQYKSAEIIAHSLERKFEVGEQNIIPSTQAKLVMQELSSRLEQIKMERLALRDELTALNGGIPIEVTDSTMLLPELPESFEAWYDKTEQLNPELAYLNNEIENSRLRLSLTKSESLPTFTLGYASEKVVGERFQGVVAGLSIPLWEKSNTIKHAKANQRYVQLAKDEYTFTYRQQAQRLYNKATSLNKLILELEQTIKQYDITSKLKLALEKGEISVVEYYSELNSYNAIRERLLEVQHEYLLTYIELNRFVY
jgi:outer membrane protein TolC